MVCFRYIIVNTQHKVTIIIIIKTIYFSYKEKLQKQPKKQTIRTKLVLASIECYLSG